LVILRSINLLLHLQQKVAVVGRETESCRDKIMPEGESAARSAGAATPSMILSTMILAEVMDPIDHFVVGDLIGRPMKVSGQVSNRARASCALWPCLRRSLVIFIV
jgi:hypothetical protein